MADKALEKLEELDRLEKLGRLEELEPYPPNLSFSISFGQKALKSHLSQ